MVLRLRSFLELISINNTPLAYSLIGQVVIISSNTLVKKFLITFEKQNFTAMAKGENKRKEDKKKPTKTLKEKRAEKREKKAGK
jgi:hypothetical protein